MRVGCIVIIDEEADIDAKFKELTDMGMHSCQVVCWDRRVLKDQKKADEVNEKKRQKITLARLGAQALSFY